MDTPDTYVVFIAGGLWTVVDEENIVVVAVLVTVDVEVLGTVDVVTEDVGAGGV